MFKDLSRSEESVMMAHMVASIDREIAALSSFAESYARADLPVITNHVIADLYAAGYKIVKVVKDPVAPAVKKPAAPKPVKTPKKPVK